MLCRARKRCCSLRSNQVLQSSEVHGILTQTWTENICILLLNKIEDRVMHVLFRYSPSLMTHVRQMQHHRRHHLHQLSDRTLSFTCFQEYWPTPRRTPSTARRERQASKVCWHWLPLPCTSISSSLGKHWLKGRGSGDACSRPSVLHTSYNL